MKLSKNSVAILKGLLPFAQTPAHVSALAEGTVLATALTHALEDIWQGRVVPAEELRKLLDELGKETTRTVFEVLLERALSAEALVAGPRALPRHPVH